MSPANIAAKTNALEREGWKMDYILTSSDGLRISRVSYKGTPILDSAKLVDWHVSYSRQDGFGYSDAVGCPVFSQAAVVAFGGPAIEEIKKDGATVGFSLDKIFTAIYGPPHVTTITSSATSSIPMAAFAPSL